MKNAFHPTLLLITCFFLLTNNLVAQVIEWQKTIGGNDQDELHSICKTVDGGFLLGGVSMSNISGDKTENCFGAYDYWIVKLNYDNNIQWQKTFGGISNDYLYSVSQTKDRGYILGGYSDSPVSGTKTDSCIGGRDCWIIKINEFGNIQWQRTLGGISDEFCYTVSPTTDNGFIIGCESKSNISGNKTDDVCANTLDLWVIKLDSVGNIQWQTSIGGTSSDHLSSIKQTYDGGYIVGGSTLSQISCEKTETIFGNFDTWVVKLDSFGNIQWQNDIGGTSFEALNTIAETNSGEFICGAHSASNISGDKSENSCNNSLDWWIFKLDTIGNILWQKTIGGDDIDYLFSISINTDECIFAGGYSFSDSSCNKTEISKGGDDYWIAKFDSSGVLKWETTIGGNCSDRFYTIQSTIDGGCIGGGWSCSDISGDKNENSKGGWDFWIVKLTENFNSISGKMFADFNYNSIRDIGEPMLPNKIVKESITNTFTFTNLVGKYNINVFDSGNFSISPTQLSYYSALPFSYTAIFTSMHQVDSLNNFAFQPSGVFNDLCVSITPLGQFRSGFNASYMINYGNYGTTTLNGMVIFYPDSNITFVSSNLIPASVSTDSIVWNTGLLSPFQMGSIVVTVHVNTGLPIGTLIYPSVHIDPIVGDAAPQCNDDAWEVYTTGSFDPNDIIVSDETLTTTQLSVGPYLDYIIRFQNTGNDTAFTVKILNPVDTSKLDLSTIEFVSSSHPVNINYIRWENNMEFKFDNILLPDSNVDEPMSHGFIRYQIKPKTALQAGDSITNYAAIYFDYNHPVLTNTAVTKIILPSGEDDLAGGSGQLAVYPNPVSDQLTIKNKALTGKENADLKIFDLFGREIYKSSIINKPSITINVSGFANGIYFVQLETGNQLLRAKFVKQ